MSDSLLIALWNHRHCDTLAKRRLPWNERPKHFSAWFKQGSRILIYNLYKVFRNVLNVWYWKLINMQKFLSYPWFIRKCSFFPRRWMHARATGRRWKKTEKMQLSKDRKPRACQKLAGAWPRGWQMPDHQAVQNMLMPHLRDWQGGQMAHRSLEGVRSWNWLMYNNNLNTTSSGYYFSYGEWVWSASSSFQSSTFSSTLFYLKVIEKP